MKTYNFCSGPAILPDEVLQEASQALINWQNTGTSILGISHRSEEFQSIASQAEQDLRTLLNIPEQYHVLFLSGGASAQFAMVPMNLLGHKKTADYVNTGYWSKMAIAEAKQYCEVRVIAEGTEAALAKTWNFHKDAAYVHCVPNETVEGIAIHQVPDCHEVPIVADMSSCLLSAPIDVNKFGLIYAGFHKNIGPAGMTVVMVKKELIQEVLANTPSLYRYALQAESRCLINTPPVFAWYTAGLVFKYLLQKGGLEEMHKLNAQKAQLLYQAIDQSHLYQNNVPQACRSISNISFQIKQPLEALFLEQAKAKGLLNLKGHRSIGGLRASLYNAMPIEGVKTLIHFMREFENQHA
ncbi:MAG: phosphoserine aminotransferase apoenzyme [Gammaproteobacteria bacterium]|nr:phosphoserine aminotransferase apoenzyme [Gammaproteobacteria bacterium]